MSVAAPDFIEPLEAWRVWRLRGSPRDLRLLSLVHQTVWPPGEELSATCERRRLLPFRRQRHDAPAEACACGIYGTSLERLLDLVREPLWAGPPEVFGRVLLWGTVVECERGWRASRAYPAEIFVPRRRRSSSATGASDRFAEGLGAYGVPVVALRVGAREALAALSEARAEVG